MASGVAMSVVNLAAFGAAYPIYLHWLGYDAYGVWLLLVTVLELGQLGAVGIAPAISKLVAEEFSRRDFGAIRSYVTTALAVLVVTGLAVGAAVALFREAIVTAFGLSGPSAALAAALLPYVGALTLYAFVVQALTATVSGLGRMDLANYAASAGRVVGVAISVGLILAGGGLESLVLGAAASYVVTHVAGVVFIRRIAPLRLLRIGNIQVRRLRVLLPFAGQVLAGSVASLLFSPFNKVMLARFAGPAALPIYDIAFSGAMQVRNILESGFRALMPEVSHLDAQDTAETRERIRSVYARSVRLLAVFGPVLYAGLVILAAPVLALWLGDRFQEPLPLAFRIILVGTFFSLLAVPAYYTLMGLGYVRHCLGAHVVQTGVNIAVVTGIIAGTGGVSVVGVAWGVLAGMLAACTYLLLQHRRADRGRLMERAAGAPLAVGAESAGAGPMTD